jgi:hypothetical protein
VVVADTLTVAASSVDGERFARLSFGVVPATFCFQIRRSTACAQPGQTAIPGEVLTDAIAVTDLGGLAGHAHPDKQCPANTTYTGETEGWGPSRVDLPASRPAAPAPRTCLCPRRPLEAELAGGAP